MLRERVLLYFVAVTAMSIAAALVGEVVLWRRVVEHSRRSDLRLASGVATHVAASLEAGRGELAKLLTELPSQGGDAAVLSRLQQDQDVLFERGSVFVLGQAGWVVGIELSAGGLPPRQILLPALRMATQKGGPIATSLWHGADGRPRVSLVAAVTGSSGWRAAVGSIRLDDRPFLSQFGFFPSDQSARLQILDGEGVALFSTVPAERYQSVVHGTYLLDLVRTRVSAQVKCHSCHQNPGEQPSRESEISTLALVDGSQWSVLVRESSKEVQPLQKEMGVIVIGIVCLILGAFFGFYWLLGRRVLAPLRQLASAAAAVSAAIPMTPSLVPAADELKRLGRSFEEMVREVEAPSAVGVGGTRSQEDATQSVDGDLMKETTSPSELRESLQRAVSASVEGFRRVELISDLIVILEGEAIGGSPLVIGALAATDLEGAAALLRLSPVAETVTVAELAAQGVSVTAFEKSRTLYRRKTRVLGALQGDVWLGTSDSSAVGHLKPVSILITLHVEGIIDWCLLANILSQEYRQKSRLLGHVLEAEATERKRVAREIHDDTAQALVALLLLLETFPVGSTPEQQTAAVRVAQQRVGGIIDSTDRIMKRLRPALLDDLGLIDALRDMGENVLTSAGIDFELDASDEDLRAEPEIEDAVFRVFQEAASNVVHHAHATHVRAKIEVAGDQIRGSFEDDGRGLHPSPAESFSDRPRFGLLGMKERVMLLGGSFHLSSSPAGGLRIDVRIPFRARKATHRVAPGDPDADPTSAGR